MNQSFEQFIEKLRGVHLSDTERGLIREKLITHMVATPLDQRAYHQKWVKRAFRKTLPIALLLALFTGATVSYAAERALPGDKLYPIKIQINERLRSAAAITDVAKAETEVSFVERRLNEAVLLEKENKLDEKRKDELKHSLKEHRGSAAVKLKNAEKKNKKGAEKVSREFEHLLLDRKDVLQRLGADDEDEDEDEDREVRATTTIEVFATSTLKDLRKKDSSDVRRKKEEKEEKHSSRGRDQEEDDEDEDEDDGDDDDDRGPRSVAESPKTPATSTPAQHITAPAPKTFTLAEVALHNNQQSCYTTIGGIVYDITSYIPIHKGGVAAITTVCGKDGSSLFANQHGSQPKPEQMLASLKIGVLAH